MNEARQKTGIGAVLADFRAPWQFCGDLLVAVARRDQALLWRYLTERGWWLELAEHGRLSVWEEGSFVETPNVRIWASKQADDPSFIEIILED